MNVRDGENENTSKYIVKLIKALIGTNSSSMALKLKFRMVHLTYLLLTHGILEPDN